MCCFTWRVGCLLSAGLVSGMVVAGLLRDLRWVLERLLWICLGLRLFCFRFACVFARTCAICSCCLVFAGLVIVVLWLGFGGLLLPLLDLVGLAWFWEPVWFFVCGTWVLLFWGLA